MIVPRHIAAILAFGALFAVPFAPSALHAESAVALASALRHAASEDWAGATAEARTSGPIAADIVLWQRLRAGKADFAEYVDFIARNGDWPGMPYLLKAGEARLEGQPPAAIAGYFANAAPQTGTGSLALAAALSALGLQVEAEAEVVRAWRSLSLDRAEEETFLLRHAGVLADHHDGRIAAMLHAGQSIDARRILPLASANTRAVAAARIALQEDGDGIDALIAAVPPKMAGSAGLAHDRFRWRILKDRYAEAGTLLLERSESADSMGDPAQWADWRRKLARKEMREGDPGRAYLMAARHHLSAGEDYSDLEWLAGYIALRKLGEPERALGHFLAFRAAVSSPISLGRAGYWEGRALEALGRVDEARTAYAEGARYQTSFYGLLAAEKVGLPLSPALAGGEVYPGWREAGFAGSSVFRAGQLLMAAGERTLAARFFLHLAEGMSGEDIGRIAGMALEADEPFVALSLAKAAADKGVIWPSAYFPLNGLEAMDLPVRADLALAIARRESEFNPTVVSPVGARGLMQVMPATGEIVARQIGVSYDGGKLDSDWQYNARLGSAYLADLIDQFGASPLLVAAGYNAGPGRPRSWIEAFGDPRAEGVDPADWVEHIPFRETQTYVMRVAESLPIYRARISGQSGPISFTAELKGR